VSSLRSYGIAKMACELQIRSFREKVLRRPTTADLPTHNVYGSAPEPLRPLPERRGDLFMRCALPRRTLSGFGDGSHYEELLLRLSGGPRHRRVRL